MGVEFAFPLWLRLTHFFNFFFMTLLIRSGCQILADHPLLYWNDYCAPGTHWIRFTRKEVPEDRLYTSMDAAIHVSPWLALPGGHHKLGMGRHWHFFSAYLWLMNGLIYVICLFISANWQRLIPTSWDIFPSAWHTLVGYIHLQEPPLDTARPYNALQQLTYAGVIFILAPLTIFTGIVQSPAVAARFPWLVRLIGGHQPARSFHFLLMVCFVLFAVGHVILVGIEHFRSNMLHIVLGQEHGDSNMAIIIAFTAIVLVILINILLNKWSHQFPRTIQHFTGRIVDSVFMLPLRSLRSRQRYPQSRLGHYFWVNGYPPELPEWRRLAEDKFKNYRLEVTGLVEQPLHLSLEDLKAMTKEVQLTEHVCIQGWSGFAEWGGVPVSEIVKRCRPKPSASCLIFHSFQHDSNGHEYYTSITLEEAGYPQTILAYEMNGRELPVNHGAPLRLRMESMLGFKMCKWISSIEFVEKLDDIGLGQGGYHEDLEYYSTWARI